MPAFDWKRTVAAVAPAIGLALGGPVAAAATSALSTALLGKRDGTEDEIAAALATGGADALLKVKEADAAFAIEMRKLDLDLERIHQTDRADARARERSTGDQWTMRSLAFLVLGAFVAMAWVVLFGAAPVDSVLAGTLIGYCSAKADQVLSYYFGSSRGSDDKTNLLARKK